MVAEDCIPPINISPNSIPNDGFLIAPMPELMGGFQFSDELLDVLPDAHPILFLDQWNGDGNPNNSPAEVIQPEMAEKVVVISQEGDQENVVEDSTPPNDISHNSSPNDGFLIAPMPEPMGGVHFFDQLLDVLPGALHNLVIGDQEKVDEVSTQPSDNSH